MNQCVIKPIIIQQSYVLHCSVFLNLCQATELLEALPGGSLNQ